MKNLMFSTVIGSMILAGCSPVTLGDGKNPVGISVSEEAVRHHDLESIEALMGREVIQIELINIADGRGPESFANEVNPDVILEYRPEKLTRALMPYLEATLKEKLAFTGQEADKTFFAEYTLKDIDTKIITGDFWSGKYGKFRADLTFDVIIRDATSKVIMQKPITSTADVARKPIKGRQPSTDLDHQNMIKALDLGIKKIALFTGWELRETLNGNRNYNDMRKAYPIDTVYE